MTPHPEPSQSRSEIRRASLDGSADREPPLAFAGSTPPSGGSPEVYDDEWGTYWVPFHNLTAEQAKEHVRVATGETCRLVVGGPVRGRVVGEAEPEFHLDPTGPDQMWQLQAREEGE